MPHYSIEELRKAQEADAVTSKLLHACSIPKPRLQTLEWNRHPLLRYHHLWSQLKIVKDVLCRHYTPDPSLDLVLVLILPTSFCYKALCSNHDAPSAGHQGAEKNPASNLPKSILDRHCGRRKSEVLSPQHAPLANIPIGRPWKMIAYDIPEVLISSKNKHYLLVVQK